MKIVFLVHQFYPEFQAGTEKFVFNMAYMSQKSGNKVKIITYGLGEPDTFPYRSQGVLYKEFHYQGLPVLAFRFEKELEDLYYKTDQKLDISFAIEILQREKPDLIHAGHLMRVYPFIIAAMQLNIPYILTLTDFHLICPKIILAPNPGTLCLGPARGVNCYTLCSELPKDFIDERQSFSTLMIQNASAVVSPSKFLAGIFKNEVDDINIIINNHGIRQTNIKSHNQVYQTGDAIRFGYIGNLTFHKGVHVLLRAFIELASPKSSLTIFGSGEDAYLEKLIEIAGKTRVDFRGTFLADELGKVFNQIDVLVIPSICYENYPFVISEAFASAVPVIASNLGGMAERIQSGNNGYLFRAGDYQDLLDKMKHILDDPTIINDMKEYIRLVTFVPNIEQEAYRYNRLYQSLYEKHVAIQENTISK
jgi:glycosyltransferase involved in cell wall biosynthesis